MDNTVKLGSLSRKGIVLVTIISSIGALASLSIAGPENTGCVQQTKTSLAPLSIITSAALQTVPDVLLSGHSANIEKWRHEQSVERTRRLRPGLMEEEEV